MALILSGLASIPRWDTKNPSSLPEGNAKHRLLWVQLQVDLAQICKGLFQVLNESDSVLGLDHCIIHVNFNISVQLGLKANLTALAKVDPALFNLKGILTK